MAVAFKTEKSITAGKDYVPSKANTNPKNGLYQINAYRPTIDPFGKPTKHNFGDTYDSLRQKVGYSPTFKPSYLADRKIEPYQGHPYDTYYDYAFPNDKPKEKKPTKPQPQPKPEPPKPEPEAPKVKPVVRTETPLPYDATKSVSRTLLIMTKNNKVRPMRTDYKVTGDFD